MNRRFDQLALNEKFELLKAADAGEPIEARGGFHEKWRDWNGSWNQYTYYRVVRSTRLFFGRLTVGALRQRSPSDDYSIDLPDNIVAGEYQNESGVTIKVRKLP
jgi:hypothetical protein